jgi:FG-GAP repeat
VAGKSALVVSVAVAMLGMFAGDATALQQQLTAGDGAATDHFGSSVAIDGDTAVVGAEIANGGRGALYVFTRSGDTWTNTAKLTASDGAANDNLGHDIAIFGDQIVASAERANDDRGAVYTFARTGGAVRTETAKLTASDNESGDRLGCSVAVSADGIVAGACGDDVANINQGSIYTFAATGAAARTETGKLTASDGGAQDSLGGSVDINGGQIVGGAPEATIGANAVQGAVYTFAAAGPVARTQTAKLTASDGTANDELGYSVAASDTVIAAGAVDDGAGSVYTFAPTGAASRTETAKLTASDGVTNDSLGFPVGASNDEIVSGAHVAGGTGAVYAFAASGAAARTETARLTAADAANGDNFGIGVAISGDEILGGASTDTVGGNAAQGSATVFYSPAPPPVIPDTTPPETTITKEPKNKLDGSKATYKFTSSEPNSSFACKFDKAKPKPCDAGKAKYKHLDGGKHKFRVVATDAAGNADPSAARDKFKVL